MNMELDIEIYGAIMDRLNASEIYLGHINYEFLYTKVEYQATCTEAFPFTPFDKIICELLQIEDTLSFHEIGRILGLNVGAIENHKSIKDNAEYEILMEALQSLSDFFMIDGGDIYFSRCRLTAIGKEYAGKKHKFRKTENKPFLIFFDKTTGYHSKAKENFEFADGHSVSSIPASPETEFDLKEIAAIQVPEIYDPAKFYSFTDERIVGSENYGVTYAAGVTFDVNTEQFVFYCYDKTAKKVNTFFSNWLQQHNEISSVVIDRLRADHFSSRHTMVSLLAMLKEQYPDEKLKLSIPNLIELKYIDQYLVLNNLKLFLPPAEKVDLYFCTPILTEVLYSSVSSLFQQSENNQSRFFIVFPRELSPLMAKRAEQLIDLSSGVSNLFVMQQNVIAFLMIADKEATPFYLELQETEISGVSIKIAVREKIDARSKKYKDYLLSSFANEKALPLCSYANEVINNDMQIPVNKEQLDKLSEIEFKLFPFANIGDHGQTVTMTLELISEFKTQRILLLNEALHQKITELLAEIDDIKDMQKIDQLGKLIDELEQQMLVNDEKLVSGFAVAKSLLKGKKEEIEEGKRIYSFIIDTNVLLDDPEVMLRIDKKHSIIIAAKVLDELDELKMDKNLSAVVSRAVKIIQQDKNRNIRHNKGRPKLLPPDLNQKTPDNLILSVAVQYLKNHGILVTSNNLLSMKAQHVLDLNVMNLQDFKAKFDHQSIKS